MDSCPRLIFSVDPIDCQAAGFDVGRTVSASRKRAAMSTALISPSQQELQGQAPISRNGDDAHLRGETDLLVVDDQPASRYGEWSLLSWSRDIRVTGTASSTAEALRLADQRRPHACLISATLGQGEALTLA